MHPILSVSRFSTAMAGAVMFAAAVGLVAAETHAQSSPQAPATPITLPGPGTPLAADQGDGRSPPVLPDIDCATAIAEAALRYRVSEGLLLAISQLESNLQRWSVTANGATQSFDDREIAVTALASLLDQGTAPVRAGCMGLDVAHGANPFPNAEDAFDARRNVEMAVADLLRQEHQSGSWMVAIGHDRGRTEGEREFYRCRVLQQLALLRSQRPTPCEQPESATASASESNEPRVVLLNDGLQAVPREGQSGPVIIRGIAGLRALTDRPTPAQATVPVEATNSVIDRRDAWVEVFRSPPTVAGGDGLAPPADRTGSADPAGSTRVQHITGTEATGTLVRELR